MRMGLCLFGLLLSCAAQAREVTVMQFGASAAPDAAPVSGFMLNNVGLSQAPRPSSEAVGQGVIDSVTDRGAPVGPHPCSQAVVPVVTTPISRDTAVRRQQYWPLVAAAECRHGLPSGLLDALVLQESRYQPAALSPAGALGLAQLMPATARFLGVADRLDPLANLDGGARFLRSQLDKFGSVPLALAAYNAGPGRVEAAGGIPANTETPGYVRNVLSYWASRVHDDQQALRATAKLLGFVTRAGLTQTAR